MRRRLIQPAIEHIRSPITLRAVALFFAIVFLAYTVTHDYQQRQLSDARYQETLLNTEAAKIYNESAKEQAHINEQNLRNTQAILAFMTAMTDILKANQKEHEILLNDHSARASPPPKKKSPPAKKKRTSLRQCFQFVPKKKRIGDTEITIHEGVDIPCE